MDAKNNKKAFTIVSAWQKLLSKESICEVLLASPLLPTWRHIARDPLDHRSSEAVHLREQGGQQVLPVQLDSQVDLEG